ncbi:hypothetical protein F383_28024 [Gossypium arboreum]|uniref:Uncharacterized protein n=1 Tax=Gossypium arboreum TaxID=29729 RepID=A0A0B0PDM2_GOSAR|nr:hypothetical protein F383_28024 [Gossypium arboreum]
MSGTWHWLDMCQCKTCLGYGIDTDGRELVEEHSWTMASSKRCTQDRKTFSNLIKVDK